MFLSSEVTFSWAGAGAGVAIVVIACLCVIIFQTIDFLLTMFVYNHVATRSSSLVRIILTAAIFFALNIVVNFISAKVNGANEQVFTSGTVISAFVDAVVGVLIAKFCTERFKGSMLAKSFKGALLYILISIVIFFIFTLIFGGAFIGGIMPSAMQSKII